MKIKTISDYPLLIGEILRRNHARELTRFRPVTPQRIVMDAAIVALVIAVVFIVLVELNILPDRL